MDETSRAEIGQQQRKLKPMKIRYTNVNLQRGSLQLVSACNRIVDEYLEQGYKLTLRQLYYQMVARGFIPNTPQSYKRLGSVVNDARLGGYMDWEAIEDRTRNLESLPCWDSPESIIGVCARTFRYNQWDGQDNYVEIWVEKEALAGVIERSAGKWDCPWIACRGYMSQSEMWAAANRFESQAKNHKGRLVILHLGDHDPSGIDMSRDIRDRLHVFMDQNAPMVVRIALNMDQVRQYNPPPNPAKVTDSRYASYQDEYGDESWELDALTPDVLDALIEENVKQYLNMKKFKRQETRTKLSRATIQRISERWDEVVELTERD